jgi:hypothetical protein
MSRSIVITPALLAAGPLVVPIGGGDRRPAIGPTELERARNFSRAATAHFLAGLPQASDVDVAARWARCVSNVCGFFAAAGEGQGQCRHKSCGCNLRRLGSESVVTPNKLRWAEQACPAGEWGPVPAAGEKHQAP